MDDREKMILENLSDDIKTLNKNVLYLCSKSSCNENRLKNIDRVINDNDDRLRVCEKKIMTMRSWGIAIGTIIIAMIPIVSALI